jgi:glyoxylase-like metal-dependent hydrolase (beta-lactamase superfamily II)
MRESLRQLLDFQFERILFAHGEPLTTNAHARLTEILEP